MFPAAVGLLALGVIVFAIGMTSASRIAEKQSRVLSKAIGFDKVNEGTRNSPAYAQAMDLASTGTQRQQQEERNTPINPEIERAALSGHSG